VNSQNDPDLNSIDVEDTYNVENRIVERESSDGRHIEIVYDGDGNRVSKTADGITVYYLVDANNLTGYAQVMEELVTNHVGALVVDRVYTYGLDLISQYKYESGPGSPYWDVSYYGYDGHGNVRFLTDSDGNITDTYDYDAFGTLTGRQVLDPSIGLVPVDASNESLVTQNHYLYCAEQFNPDLGLYFLRARYMDPERGRFWTMDVWEGVIQDPRTLHKYLYVNANPVDYVDPLGLVTLQENMVVGTITGLFNGTIASVYEKSFLRGFAVGFIGGALGAAGGGIAAAGSRVIGGALVGIASGFFAALSGEIIDILDHDPSTSFDAVNLTIGAISGGLAGAGGGALGIAALDTSSAFIQSLVMGCYISIYVDAGIGLVGVLNEIRDTYQFLNATKP
jgi:RHS repeat-associated protein